MTLLTYKEVQRFNSEIEREARKLSGSKLELIKAPDGFYMLGVTTESQESSLQKWLFSANYEPCRIIYAKNADRAMSLGLQYVGSGADGCCVSKL
jgi:hypothetical protein